VLAGTGPPVVRCVRGGLGRSGCSAQSSARGFETRRRGPAPLVVTSGGSGSSSGTWVESGQCRGREIPGRRGGHELEACTEAHCGTGSAAEPLRWRRLRRREVTQWARDRRLSSAAASGGPLPGRGGVSQLRSGIDWVGRPRPGRVSGVLVRQ
jgi:hypothetical protein